MPTDPLVMVFFADYYKMDEATQPYLEAAVFRWSSMEANWRGTA